MNDRTTRILVIGNPNDGNLIQESLKQTETAEKFDIINEYSLESALKRVTNDTTTIFDTIILDSDLLDKQGLDIVKTIVKEFPDLPVITLITDIKNKGLAIETLPIQDYILKEDIIKDKHGDLLRSIRYVIELKKITNALRESEKKYKHVTETVLEDLWIYQIHTKLIIPQQVFQSVFDLIFL